MRPMRRVAELESLDSTLMAEDIRLSPDGTHILVSSVGPPSLDELAQTLSKLAQLRLNHRVDKVLVDSRARSGQPSVAAIYSGGKLLAETLGPGMRIAVLVGQIERDQSLFENVAVNRGAAIAFFQHEQQALSWLLKSGR